MKKLLFAVLMLSLLTACERNAESNGSFEQQQKNEQLKNSNNNAKAESNSQNSEASELDTTDPKDIIVPPRH